MPFDWDNPQTWAAALEEVLAGTVSLPVDDVQEPFVGADDIADVVVAALTDDRHIGQLYELTGPRLLSFREAVAERSAGPQAVTSASRRFRSRTTPRCSRNTVCRKTLSGCSTTCSPRCSAARSRDAAATGVRTV
jgi:nucleoside-diphosphate-sugar epimerase